MTDLPDADAAWQEWARHWPYESTWPNERPPVQSVASRESFLAGFAAASGPWAEQLDAANAERDAARERLAETYAELGLTHLVTEGQLDSIQTQAERIKSSDKAWSEAVERASKAEAQLDAALARNAELEALVKESMDATAIARGKALDPIIENERLRAELDNLRDRVNALADAEHSVEHLYEAEELRYTGVVVADDLRALVRGSDDEADEPFTKDRPRHLWEGNFTPPEDDGVAR